MWVCRRWWSGTQIVVKPEWDSSSMISLCVSSRGTIRRAEVRASNGSRNSSFSSAWTRTLDRRRVTTSMWSRQLEGRSERRMSLLGRLDDLEALIFRRHLPMPDPHIAAAGVDLAGEVEAGLRDIMPRPQRPRAACSVWLSVGMPSAK